MNFTDDELVSRFAKTPTQQISALKKAISRLKAELICKTELNVQLNKEVENLQIELITEKQKKTLLWKKYTKLRQQLLMLSANFKEICKKLCTNLKDCYAKNSNASVSFESIMELQIQLDSLVASLEDEDNFVTSDIRSDFQKTIKVMKEMVKLMDSMDEVKSSPDAPKMTGGKNKFACEKVWFCGICLNSFSNQATFLKHQTICSREVPSTSKKLSASFSGNAGMSTPSTRSATRMTGVKSPPSNLQMTSPYKHANFCKLAKIFAKTSSTSAISAPSVVAVTVLEPTKIFVANKHRRDVTKRHDGYFCHCGIRFVTTNGINQHQMFQFKTRTNPPSTLVFKNENN